MKGFIGPIGDDIPSIFPIIAGITLFIGTIFYANAEAASKASQLNLRKSALELSYVALEKGYIDSISFAQDCDSLAKPVAQKDGVQFALVLTNCTSYSEGGITGGGIICKSPLAPSNLADLSNKSIAILDYPVSSNCIVGGELRPGIGRLSIVTWYQ